MALNLTEARLCAEALRAVRTVGTGLGIALVLAVALPIRGLVGQQLVFGTDVCVTFLVIVEPVFPIMLALVRMAAVA